jgi:hypothetical protein
MAMAPWRNNPILLVVGIYHGGEAAVAVLCHGELVLVVADTCVPEVPGHAAGNGMEAGAAGCEVGAAANGEQGVAVCGEQRVTVCGEQGSAVRGDPEVEVVARDEEGMELVELRGAAGGVRGDHGAWLHCHDPGDHGACGEMHCCGTAQVPLPASSPGGAASHVQIRSGMLVARPASSHAGDASPAQVHGTPSLVPPHWQRGPAGRCCKAAMHHLRREPVPELLQLTGRSARRHCRTTAASLQERGEEPCSSCLCWWPC